MAKTGILFVAHGSRSQENNQAMKKVFFKK